MNYTFPPPGGALGIRWKPLHTPQPWTRSFWHTTLRFLCLNEAIFVVLWNRLCLRIFTILEGFIMSKWLAVLCLLTVQATGAGAQSRQSAEQDKAIHLNQIQVIGSHNSYHTGIAPSERKLIGQQNPKAMRALDYEHPPIPEQLSHGVRQVEIDVYADSKGGATRTLPSCAR